MPTDSLIQQWIARDAQPGDAVDSFRNGISIQKFDDAINKNLDFYGIVPEYYEGGDLRAEFEWVADTATTGNVRWQLLLERWEVGVSDIDVIDFIVMRAGNFPTDTTAAGEINQDTGDLSSSDLNLQAGESFRFEIRRIGSNAGDTMVGDAHLLSVGIKEV